MSSMCKSLAALSSQGLWDDVFFCLGIDGNSTIDTAHIKIPQDHDVAWLGQAQSSLNTLEVVLAIILLCDQIMYIMLLLFLILTTVKVLRIHILNGGGTKMIGYFQGLYVKYRNFLKLKG